MSSNYPFKIHLITLIPSLALLGGLWLSFDTEVAVNGYFMALRPDYPVLTDLVKWFTDLSNAALYLLYGFLLARGLVRRRDDLWWFALACLLAHLIIVVMVNPLLKTAIGRPRPMYGGPFEHFAFDSVHVSFPSGHTTAMAGLVLPLMWRYARKTLPALGLGLFIALMGFSRIYLSEHYLSDILGGLVMGSFLSYLAWKLTSLMKRAGAKKTQKKAIPGA